MEKETILNEVLSAEMGGAREIVLSSVHLASWGKDLSEGECLSDLISFLLVKTDIERIRLSSNRGIGTAVFWTSGKIRGCASIFIFPYSQDRRLFYEGWPVIPHQNHTDIW